MKHFLLSTFLSLICMAGFAQLSGSYTIDPAQAASATNYQDVVSAVFDLTQSAGNRPDGGPRVGPGVSGAVDFAIASGTYKGQLKLTTISGASSSNTITFRSAVGNSKFVIIADSAVSAATNGTVHISGADYLYFKQLTIRALNKVSGTGFSTTVIIDSNGTDVSSFNTFYGCRFESNWYITNKNLSSVYINGYQNDVSLIRDTFYNASCGVYVDGNRNGGNYTPNLTIDSCNFTNTGSDVFQPFYIRYVQNLKITHTNVFKSGCCADRLGTIFGLRAPAEISNNKFTISSSAGNGIDFDSVNLFNDNAQVRIYNNFFQNLGTSGYILSFARTFGTSIVNNSFNQTGSSGTYNMIQFSSNDSSKYKNNEIYNNLFISNAATILSLTGTNLAVVGKLFSTLNYNNIWRVNGSNQNIYNVVGNSITNLQNIPNAVFSGSDVNTSFTYTKYLSNTDLHLNRISCMVGIPVSYISTDIDGQTRNNPPTIGADEVNGGTGNNDIGIVSLLAPTSSIYTAGSQDIRVLVKNYGSNTITSFDINYTVNGGSPVTLNYTGSLGTCDTVTMVFTGANQINFASGSYFVKIYTNNINVNGGLDSNRVNDTVTNTYCTPMAGNYTIDAGQAASSTNFQNFTQLANTLNSCGITAAVNVSVAAGTYFEHIYLGNISGNDSNNMIVIDGGAGNTATRILKSIAYNPAVNYLVKIDGVKGIQFSNLTFRSDSATIGNLFYVAKSQKLMVNNCTFDYAGSAFNSTNNTLINFNVSNNGTNANIPWIIIDSCRFNRGYNGILSSMTAGNILRVSNSSFNQQYYSSINANGGSYRILKNNIAMRSANSTYAIYMINTNANNANNYCQINSNTISELGSYGIYMSSTSGGNNASNKGEIYNNMIGGKFMGTNSIYGINMNYSNHWKVYHNTIAISSSSATAKNVGVYVAGGASYTTEYKNNSITIEPTSLNGALCMDIQGTNHLAASGVDYNNYYNGSSANIMNIAGNLYDNTNYHGAFPAGGGVNSVDGLPAFNAANDLHVTGTQLNDRGTPLNVTEDIDGDNRSTSNPDIGADEYAAINKHDLAVNKLIAPAAASCLGGFNTTITAEIKNMGIDTVDLTSDTVWVSANVEDPNNVVTNHGATIITGIILYPQDKITVDITTKYDMSEGGTYYFSPYLTWNGDSNAVNNVLKNQGRDATNPAPVWSPTFPKTSICNGDSVKLALTNSKNTTDFFWYMNGNPLSYYDSVLYVTMPGTYVCELSNNSCNVFSDTIVIKSGNNPNVSISASKSLFCSGDSAMLSTIGNAAYSYQWVFNGSPISGATDSLYYGKLTGDYSVMVKDTASGCTVISNKIALTAYSAINATITYPGKSTICMGDSLRLATNSASGLTYQWSFNGGTINGATDSILYVNKTGDYSVKVANATGCSNSSNIVSITVDSLPNNAIQSRGNSKACGADTVYIDAVNHATYTYDWMNNGTSLGLPSASSLMVLSNGNYSVKITNANGCTSTSSIINISYKLKPSVPALNGAATPTICIGDSMRISVSPADTGAFSYQWKLNGNDINGAVDSFVYIKTAGAYTAEIMNNGGCATTAGSNITLANYPAATPSLSATGATTICNGDSVSLTAANTATGVQSVSWLLNAAIYTGGGSNNPLFAKTAGSYEAKIVDNNGCKSVSNAIAVTVNPLPTPTITENKPASELSTGAFASYQWYLNGTAISGATAQKHTIKGNGDYMVEVTDANGCKGKSAVNSVTWYIGISQVSGAININVYPNPSNGIFNIELPKELNSGSISLTDIAGRQINTNIQNNKNVYMLDLNNQPAGVYILHLSQEGQIYQVRLIKY